MNKKINLDIIMLSDFDRNAGGRETWLYNFLPELLRKEDIQKVTLFGYSNKTNNNYVETIETLNKNDKNEIKKLFPIILKGKQSKWPMAYSMFKLLKKYPKEKKSGIKIALAMGVFELIMILFIKRFKNAKKVVWLRSIFIHEKAYIIPKWLRKIILKIELHLLKKVDVIISNGSDIQDFYKSYGLDIHVIKNGINIEKWKLPPIKFNTPLHVAYIGRLSQVKGIESYLALAEKVKKGNNHSNFIFHTVGEEGVYKRQIKVLVENNVVKNHGVISNQKLPEFLEGIDVCVALTYASETGGGGGTSNAMLEQMAASRVMLAWDNVIFKQYINEDNGYLVEQYSINDLNKALLNIYTNRIKAKEKAIKARESVKPYTYVKNVNDFLMSIKN